MKRVSERERERERERETSDEDGRRGPFWANERVGEKGKGSKSTVKLFKEIA